MLDQLGVSADTGSELRYLVKVRDRFFSHVQLTGLARGPDHGWSQPERGFLRRDVVSHSAWSFEDLRVLGRRALSIGSPEWREQRQQNEALVLSRKRGEDLTRDELQGPMAAGVRECDVELAISQLAELLRGNVLAIVERQTRHMIDEFGWERPSEWAAG